MFNGLTINECVSWLNDVPRNQWYKDKIRSMVKGKTVFEVGCGSGLLAAYCLEYGAKHYYGIDIREHRADYTRRLLREMGYNDRVTIFSKNFFEFLNLDDKIDILLVEQTGNQLQNNFMIRQIWQHAQKIFPYKFDSLPDQWEIDVEVYEGSLNSQTKETHVSRLLNDSSLPTGYFDAVNKLSIMQPTKIVKDAFTINPGNCFDPIEFSIETSHYNNVSMVLQDTISYRGDRCYTASAVSDWPDPPVLTKLSSGNYTNVYWDDTLTLAPHFFRGYWVV